MSYSILIIYYFFSEITCNGVVKSPFVSRVSSIFTIYIIQVIDICTSVTIPSGTIETERPVEAGFSVEVKYGWYNLLSGKWEFGKVHATETTVEGVTVELTTNGRHANYEMKLSGFDLDTSANKVYGVVLTTADGSEYGLHHVTNIWRGTELGFNTDETYLASIIGKTVTQITYYTADGVYVLPVNVAL